MTTLPTTKAEADAYFRCEAHLCAMSGKACAERWARAQDADNCGVVVAARAGMRGFSVSMKGCVGCPLGQARHRLGATDRAAQLHQIEVPRPAAPEPEEDTMRKRADLTPTAEEILGWALGRNWWSRADVDGGVERREGAVGDGLRQFRGLGLLEGKGRTSNTRYRITKKGLDRADELGLKMQPPSPAPAPAPAPPPPAPEPTMPDPRWGPGGPDAPDPLPLGPAELDPPAEPRFAAEVVELQPEVVTLPSRLPSEDAADAAADAYIAARDRLRRAAQLAVQLLDGEEVEVIAAAEGLQRLADTLQASYRALDDARGAVAADRYEALLEQMGVAA